MSVLFFTEMWAIEQKQQLQIYILKIPLSVYFGFIGLLLPVS